MTNENMNVFTNKREEQASRIIPAQISTESAPSGTEEAAIRKALEDEWAQVGIGNAFVFCQSDDHAREPAFGTASVCVARDEYRVHRGCAQRGRTEDLRGRAWRAAGYRGS